MTSQKVQSRRNINVKESNGFMIQAAAQIFSLLYLLSPTGSTKETFGEGVG